MIARSLLAAVALILTVTASAALPASAADMAADSGTNGGNVAGVWWTPNHNGKIAISIGDTGVISGQLIALSPEDADAKDEYNPDPSLRTRPVLGLVILQGFTLGGDGAMTGGTIYDPESGRTYYGSLSFDQDGKLVMRASIAFSLLWRTEVLQRVDGPTPEIHQDGEPDLVYLAR